MRLLESGRIGRLLLKNRIVMAPMVTAMAVPVQEERLSQRDIDFYTARARGGVGLITTSAMHPTRKLEKLTTGEPVVSSVRCMSWLSELAEAVHDYGAKVAVQLSPGLGRNAMADECVCASALPNFFRPDIICRELTIEEIKQLVKDFEFSCQVISSAGIDLIEIHAHQGYLLDEFMTALWNKRTDEYGGDLDGRLRLPLELIAAAKRGAGANFPITFRFGLTHYLDGGRTIQEGLEIARRLEAAGVDALHIDAGCYETNNRAQPPTTQPPGCNVHLAKMVKEVVGIPVIVVGRLGYPDLAEKVLEEGKADFIALGRALLADPEWPNKVKEGRLEDIIPCLGCHEGCIERIISRKHVSCAVNPTTGNEKEFTLRAAERKKSVLVIGGGPAGMEAARVSALRGHKVTLWEKGYDLGGNLIPAAVPGFKHDYRRLINYLSTQIRKLGVTTKLGVEATPELIQAMKPDVVFIATGATPVVPDIPGIEKGIAATSVEVLLGKKEVGESVVIIGGGMVGCETALYLAQQGKKVTIIEILDKVMSDMLWINAMDLQELLDDANVKIETSCNVQEIIDEGLIMTDRQDKKRTLEADTIILAVGLKPNRELVETLQGKLPELYVIGDCVESRRVINAIWEGFRTARLI